MATLPTIPVEPAGVIAASADLNAWANACSFLLGSGSGSNPVFLLQASSAQSIGTTFAAVNFSNSGAIFKDNDGGWSSSTPGRYTFQTTGFFTIDWSVPVGAFSGFLMAYAQVTTGSSNPQGSGVTYKFQFTSSDVGSIYVALSSGGVMPQQIYAGDYLQVYAATNTGTVNTSNANGYPYLTGELVSA